MTKPMSAAAVEAHLSELLDRAAAGQETVITRRGKPVAKIVPANEAVAPKRQFGVLNGTMKYDNATLWALMSEQELAEIEGPLVAVPPMPKRRSGARRKA